MTQRHSIVVAAAVLLAVNLSAMAGYIDLVNHLDPLAVWRLGESAGSVAAESVQGIDGTYRGEVVYGQEGGIAHDSDTSVGFHARGYVEAPHSGSFLLRRGTVQLWFKDTGTIREAGLFSKDSCGYDTGGLDETSGGAGNFEPIVLAASARKSGDQSATPLGGATSRG